MLSPKQQEARKSGIGASESADILGLGWRTPYELWMIKTGRIEAEDISQKPSIIMGNLLEPVIASRYEELTGEKVRRVSSTLYHAQYPHILCHIDRKIEGKRKALEIKTASPFDKGWGEHGSDEIPPVYLIQVQHQLAVTGYEEADLIVLRGTDFRIYPFRRDEQLIATIIDRVNHFWEFNVLQDVAPEVTTRGDCSLMYPLNNGTYVDATPEILSVIQQLKMSRDFIKEHEETKKEEQFQLIKFIGESDGIKVNDKVLMTYIANKRGIRSLIFKETGE